MTPASARPVTPAATSPAGSAAPSAAAPPAAVPGRGRRLRLIVVLGALSAFGPLSIDMYLPALPALAGDLGVRDADVQLTLTACLLGLALGQLVAGPLSDRRGRRGPLLVGLAGYVAASVLCAVAPNAEILTAARLLQGLAGAAGIVISRAIVRDLYDGVEAARFFSLLMMVNGLAPILAPVVGGQLLRFADWRAVFAVLAAVGAVLLAAAVLALPESLPAERRSGGGLARTVRSFGGLLADRRFTGYALSAGSAFAAMFAYISGSSFVLQQVYGLDAQQFGLVFAGNALGLVLLGQVNARLLRTRAPQVMLRAGLAVSAAGGAGLLVAVVGGLGLWAVCGSLFLVVSAVGLVMPNSTALALSGRENAGTASALLGLLQFALGGLAAPLVGLGGSGSALPMAVVIAGFAGAAVLVHALWLPRPDTVAAAPASL
ncbi:Bcr/CflA family multidrug efflux MFS transporter [Kitasatospora sp. DSM 101779]|uniref:Bcr/CflA family multidrug efflux MFS transporter n=1 Tax=Kitasatospora sp. DSM 101779 TaxID=2853165 RepID=UPI0021D863C0|nr:Bcr/CflA family multidrug efflux MFS transporter [Kitasatospora sp. DSM 101779]MCU7821327.1 Bcr/CflA family multidrug efflux MFS transporter [Kitasatospora sp. DSM 101779]